MSWNQALELNYTHGLEFMFQRFKSLILLPLQLHSLLSLHNAYQTIPGARLSARSFALMSHYYAFAL